MVSTNCALDVGLDFYLRVKCELIVTEASGNCIQSRAAPQRFQQR